MTLNFAQARALAVAHHDDNGPPETFVSPFGFRDDAAWYFVTGTADWLTYGGPPDVDPIAYLVDQVSGRVTETTPMSELDRLDGMERVGVMAPTREDVEL